MGLFSFIKDAGTKLFGGGDSAEEQGAKATAEIKKFQPSLEVQMTGVRMKVLM